MDASHARNEWDALGQVVMGAVLENAVLENAIFVKHFAQRSALLEFIT